MFKSMQRHHQIITDGQYMQEIQRKMGTDYQLTLRKQEKERAEAELTREKFSKQKAKCNSPTKYVSRNYERPWALGMSASRKLADYTTANEGHLLNKGPASRLPALPNKGEIKRHKLAAASKKPEKKPYACPPANRPYFESHLSKEGKQDTPRKPKYKVNGQLLQGRKAKLGSLETSVQIIQGRSAGRAQEIKREPKYDSKQDAVPRSATRRSPSSSSFSQNAPPWLPLTSLLLPEQLLEGRVANRHSVSPVDDEQDGSGDEQTSLLLFSDTPDLHDPEQTRPTSPRPTSILSGAVSPSQLPFSLRHSPAPPLLTRPRCAPPVLPDVERPEHDNPTEERCPSAVSFQETTIGINVQSQSTPEQVVNQGTTSEEPGHQLPGYEIRSSFDLRPRRYALPNNRQPYRENEENHIPPVRQPGRIFTRAVIPVPQSVFEVQRSRLHLVNYGGHTLQFPNFPNSSSLQDTTPTSHLQANMATEDRESRLNEHSGPERDGDRASELSLRQRLTPALFALSHLRERIEEITERSMPSTQSDTRPPADPEKLNKIKESLLEEECQEDEGDLCRICQSGVGTPSNPLLKPCKCTGSLQYVHHDCLKQWLQTKIKSGAELSAVQTCELCKENLNLDLNEFDVTEYYQKHHETQSLEFINTGIYLFMLLHLYEHGFPDVLRLYR
ncbi:probable E3 ubiquitin-protein ligase MARCHF10 [Erpetoichthys calabaricus]|nr:probable E3 ubiquitin-protein ligase MARCHF10 [Erpetoichthys calabaricus]